MKPSDHIDGNLVRMDKITLLSVLFRMGGGAETFEFEKSTTFDGETIRARIVAPGTLGAAEQDLLYAISSIALRQRCEAENSKIIVKTNHGEILMEMGRRSDSSKEYDRLRQSAQNLANIIVTLERESLRKKYVAFAKDLMIRPMGDLDGNLTFELHPLLSSAILGNNYIGIDIRERMSLGETARILHSALCARINPGSFGKQRVGALMVMLFGSEEVTARRKAQFNRAREEMLSARWKIDIMVRGETTQATDVATIFRPAKVFPGASRPRPSRKPSSQPIQIDEVNECPF